MITEPTDLRPVSMTVEVLAKEIYRIDDIEPEFATMIATGLLPFIERHIAAGQKCEYCNGHGAVGLGENSDVCPACTPRATIEPKPAGAVPLPTIRAYAEIRGTDDPDVFEENLWAWMKGMPVPEGENITLFCALAEVEAYGDTREAAARGVTWSAEDACEAFIAAEIDAAPEALRRLGEWLNQRMDEDDAKTASRMVLGAMMETSAAIRAVGEAAVRADAVPDDYAMLLRELSTPAEPAQCNAPKDGRTCYPECGCASPSDCDYPPPPPADDDSGPGRGAGV